MTNTRPTSETVKSAYAIMLGRPPENEAAIISHLEHAKTEAELVANIANSNEFASRIGAPVQQQSPFWHFNASIPIRQIVESHVVGDRRPMDGHYVNFLGVAIPTRVMDFLHDKGGQLDVVPLPANFHADMAEWAGALRAVDLSGDTFSMIELGCGWGCWMNNTGAAARSRGKSLDLIGIEGDAYHIDMAKETFAVNGIKPEEYTIYQGIAAATTGYALFSKRQAGEEGWGFAPRFGVSETDSDAAVASGAFERQEMIPLERAIGKRKRIDLLHIDIQGGEDALVGQSLPIINDRVAYMLIGTHSRPIEGRLIDALQNAGWFLEIERPAIISLESGAPVTTVDGVQAWANPKYRR